MDTIQNKRYPEGLLNLFLAEPFCITAVGMEDKAKIKGTLLSHLLITQF